MASLIWLIFVNVLLSSAQAQEPPEKKEENVVTFRTLNINLKNGATISWLASRGSQNLTLEYDPAVMVEIKKVAERKLINVEVTGTDNNAASQARLSGWLVFLLTALVLGRHERIYALIIILAVVTVIVFAQDVPDNSVQVVIPSEIIQDICINGVCRPLLCHLNVLGTEGNKYSSIPSNNQLLFKQNVSEPCMIREPEDWQEWKASYFGPNRTETEYSFYGDPDGDGVINIVEYYGSMLFEDLFVNNNKTRQRHRRQTMDSGTDPTNPDMDGDLLTDAFELFNGLDPKVQDSITEDYDNDGLDNLKEQILGTDPLNADSDGDGIPDGQEAAEGGDPADPEDENDDDSRADVKLTIGDPSGSHSERYIMTVGGVSHQSPDYGVVGSGVYTFKSGRYPITIAHQGTNRPNEPDYDYTASVQKAGGLAKVSVNDTEGILGYHQESSYFYAQGKSALMTVEGDCPEDSTDPKCICNWLDSCGSCAENEGCIWDRKTQVCKVVAEGFYVQKELARLECLAIEGDCQYYQEVNKLIPCDGQVNYAIDYGYKYCTRFSQYYNEFNDKGKKWVDNVRKCLMLKLIPSVQNQASCPALKESAYDTHPYCYVVNGACTLGPQNWIALYDVLEFKDLASWDGVKQIYITFGGCEYKTIMWILELFGYIDPLEPYPKLDDKN